MYLEPVLNKTLDRSVLNILARTNTRLAPYEIGSQRRDLKKLIQKRQGSHVYPGPSKTKKAIQSIFEEICFANKIRGSAVLLPAWRLAEQIECNRAIDNNVHWFEQTLYPEEVRWYEKRLSSAPRFFRKTIFHQHWPSSIGRDKIAIFDLDFMFNLNIKRTDQVLDFLAKHSSKRAALMLTTAIGRNNTWEEYRTVLRPRLIKGIKKFGKVIEKHSFSYTDSSLPMAVEIVVFERK